ncbi:ribosomal RNA small subunit methyltransferase I [Luteitalea sp. TBR-22]|uniref:16S rRNA (cytidine(1402)-2'-O)-methyltransferase n=1 Tax=Luteitalea sp. TBR-22 TaxID=2802971 RepID=UPI001EF4EEA1|nr:16S rRNA (cytidine(1402)-2'-O)-methyltransferase [Luteitalea sp. TBR-22]BCS30809.2 ribosomal RNA small subunit methyltransferase I [Luteitalea sp. TBR-22]
MATPIGNLEDITLRALRVLREARVIAAEDTRRTAKLLAHAGIETPMVSVHAHNEVSRLPGLLEKLRAGEPVALVTDAGTPLLSDPGDHLIRACLDEGIPVEPVPGASAVLAALTMSGVPASAFTFLGFPPVKNGPRRRWCEEAGAYQHPVVFFEAPHRIAGTLGMLAEIVGGQRRIAVCREITKKHEQLIRGAIGEVVTHPAIAEPIGEFTCILEAPLRTEIPAAIVEQDLLDEFDRITEKGTFERRAAMSEVARRLHVRTRDVFDALERRKAAEFEG